MRLLPSDPDVETLVARIEKGDLDLQPDFQRGEVWLRGKKQRLIDSVLRDWHVPPIHVIENRKTKKQEVLDGQQRLTAIRDFVRGEFPIDGWIEPQDARIRALHGKYYEELSPEWKRLFNRFAIRMFLLVDFKPSEPGELFFRLNQPVNLTSAEQRNAFFGPVREQIKGVIADLTHQGLSRETLGFSNVRMAYDDVLARLVLVIDRNTIADRITSKDLEELYRSERPLSKSTVHLSFRALSYISEGNRIASQALRFNKASLLSWSLFLVRASLHDYTALSPELLANFIDYFQSVRDARSTAKQWSETTLHWLYTIYDSRTSFRVSDASSVVLRDATLWLMYSAFVSSENLKRVPASIGVQGLEGLIERGRKTFRIYDDKLAKEITEMGWPRLNGRRA